MRRKRWLINELQYLFEDDYSSYLENGERLGQREGNIESLIMANQTSRGLSGVHQAQISEVLSVPFQMMATTTTAEGLCDNVMEGIWSAKGS